MKPWVFLKRATALGRVFETTLLGRVPWRINDDGEYEAVITDRLSAEANGHGFKIESADLKRGAYKLRRISVKGLLNE